MINSQTKFHYRIWRRSALNLDLKVQFKETHFFLVQLDI